MTLDDFFKIIANTAPDPVTKCVEWQRGCFSSGYVQVKIGRHPKRGNRLVLERKLGRPINDKMNACHHCDNPRCLNFEHLYEGTQKQNMRDALSRNRRLPFPKVINRANGSRIGSSKLSEADVLEIRARAPKSNYFNWKPLADEFGVGPLTIRRIVQRKTWKHI